MYRLTGAQQEDVDLFLEEVTKDECGTEVTGDGGKLLIAFEGFTDECWEDASGKTWEELQDELEEDFDEGARQQGYHTAMTELSWQGDIAYKVYS